MAALVDTYPRIPGSISKKTSDRTKVFANKWSSLEELNKTSPKTGIMGTYDSTLELFPWQNRFYKLMSEYTPYKEMVLAWKTGRGKTKGAKKIVDIIMELVDFQGMEQEFKPIIIMKASLLRTWQEEFSEDGRYLSEEFKQKKYSELAAHQTKRTTFLTKTLKRYVEFVKQDTLVARLEEMDNRQIRELYGRRKVVVWDEAHTGKALINIDPETNLDDEGIIIPESFVTVNKKDENVKPKRTWAQMMRFMQLCSGVKILLTATPVNDSPEELASIMNFVLPAKLRFNLADFKTALYKSRKSIKKYIEPRLIGRLYWLDEKDTRVELIDQGEDLYYDEENSGIKVYNVRMSKYQSKIYAYAKSVQDNGSDQGSGEKDSWRLQTTKAANFTFPFDKDMKDNESYTKEWKYKEGFIWKAVPRKGKIKKQSKNLRPERTYPILTENRGLYTFQFRANMNNVFTGLGDLEDKKTLNFGDPLPKNRLEVVRRLSAKAAKLIELTHLEENQKFPGEWEQVFCYTHLVKDGGGILVGMAFDFIGYERYTGEQIVSKKRCRYSYITGDPGSTPKRNHNILKFVNKPANLYGEYLAVTIVSKVAATGISFMNARKFVHFGPDYTRIEQVEGRTIRANSQKAFPRDDQRYVRKYLFAATMYNGEQTYDHYIWDYVANKTRNTSRLEDVIREVHDKVVNKDVPRSYNLYYNFWAEEEYHILESRIRNLFLASTCLTFDEILEAMPVLQGPKDKSSDKRLQHRKIQAVTRTLARMISREDLVQDSFGVPRILKESSGVYFLASALPLHSEEYAQIKSKSAQTLALSENKDVVSIHRRFKRDAVEEIDIFDGMSMKQIKTMWLSKHQDKGVQASDKHIYLEKALMGKIKNDDFKKFILNYTSPSWYITDDYIFHYYSAMTQNITTSRHTTNPIKLTSNHIFRIFRPGKDTKFTNASKADATNLAKIVNSDWRKREIELSNKGFDWIIIRNKSSDRDFRVKKLERLQTASGKIDGRGNRGRVLLDSPKEVFINMLYDLRVFPEGHSMESLQDLSDDEDEGYIPDDENLAAMKSWRNSKELMKWSPAKERFFEIWFNEVAQKGHNLFTIFTRIVTQRDLVFYK